MSTLDLAIYNAQRLAELLQRSREAGECLEWTGARDRAGYGRTSYLGRQGITAHRAVWLASGREIPSGLELDHVCHNRACVRLEHLRAVTHGENMANRRQPQGECRRGHAKSLAPRGIYVCYVCLAASVKRWRWANPQKARELWRRRRRR